jgi:hypothetical protein
MIKYPSTQRWGREVTKLTFRLVLDCWNERNNCEHDNHGDSNKRAKEKIVEKIQWEIGKNQEMVPDKYKELGNLTLMELPKENLGMMGEQLSNLKA